METTKDRAVAMQIPEAEQLEPIHTKGLQRVFGILRLMMGWTFLWAFLDKAFALGFSTGRLEDGTIDTFAKGAAWFNGGDPTAGVFAYALVGPFKGFYEGIGNVTMTQQGPVANPPELINILYMASMLLIGLGLMTGVMTRIAAVSGIIWLTVFYTATAMWPEHNPFLDDHLVYIVILVGLILANAGRYWGLGKVWQEVGFVKGRKFLY
jgi:thiosulfate dehydrogenase [quinone] large subunit